MLDLRELCASEKAVSSTTQSCHQSSKCTTTRSRQKQAKGEERMDEFKGASIAFEEERRKHVLCVCPIWKGSYWEREVLPCGATTNVVSLDPPGTESPLMDK